LVPLARVSEMTPPAEVTRTPLGVCDLAEALPVVLGQYLETGPALDRAAPDDPLSCDPGAPVTRPRGRLYRIHADASLHLWATGGPWPDLSGLFPPVLIRVYRGCPGEPGSTLVACGDTLGIDLAPGKYFLVAVQTSGEQGANPPTGAFGYRVSPQGDTGCSNEDLAGRRLDDWMGEAPPEVREVGDLNRDSRSDWGVEYRSKANALSTRLLVTDDYPRCLRTVLDGPVTVKVDGGELGGWKNLRTSARSGVEADDPNGVLVEHRASYDGKLGRYVEGKRLGCTTPSSGDTPKSVPCPAALR
jgi:hypothetical protein